MSHPEIINTSQGYSHKYEKLKTEKNIFEMLLAPLKRALILGSLNSSKMSYSRCVYINNRCGYQSITQQYLKKMFNKG